MPGRRPRKVDRSAGALPGAWGGYSVRRSGRFVEAAMGFSFGFLLVRVFAGGLGLPVTDPTIPFGDHGAPDRFTRRWI